MKDIISTIGGASAICLLVALISMLRGLKQHRGIKQESIAVCVSFGMIILCALLMPGDSDDKVATDVVGDGSVTSEYAYDTTESADTEEEVKLIDAKATSEKASEETAATTTELTVTSGSELSEIRLLKASDIPAFADIPYVEINGNIPYFTEEEKKKIDEFEYYSALDPLGRCGTAYANISPKSMPTEERGEIGRIKPSGWHLDKYNDLIDGNYLYNRCHLIAYCLAGENDNELNLITGTRYMNIEGMNPFELNVLDYVRAKGNHVLYRVTPVFEGDDLLVSGVEMEAWSVEDNGTGICFNVYCYNVQPGIEIDYATGDNRLSEDAAVSEQEVVTIELTEYTTEKATEHAIETAAEHATETAAEHTIETAAETEERTVTESVEAETQYDYILNTNSRKIHVPYCSSVVDMAEHNKQGFNGTIEEAKAMGYTSCKRCLNGY